jgi:hypothetical protein
MNTLMISLDGIRDHLDSHVLPAPLQVQVNSWADPVMVQLGGGTMPEVARALSAWAATLNDPRAGLWLLPDGASVHLRVTGRTACGVSLHVYAPVPFDPVTFPDLPPRTDQDMPVWLLRQWARIGEEAA